MSENEYPPIPEGSKDFRVNEVSGDIEFYDAGAWLPVSYVVHCRSGDEFQHIARNMGNAAIVAWWDELERRRIEQNALDWTRDNRVYAECFDNIRAWRKWRDGEDWRL